MLETIIKMRTFITILVLMIFLSRGITQIRNHAFIQDSHWMDGIGSIDVIAFDEDSIYKQYKWFTSSQVLNQVNYGSYNDSEGTVLCQPISTNAESFEFVVVRVHKKKYKLLSNLKIYNIDGTLSDLRLHSGRYGEEFTKEQYKKFKTARAKN